MSRRWLTTSARSNPGLLSDYMKTFRDDTQLKPQPTDDDRPSFDNATQFCPPGSNGRKPGDSLHTAYQRALSSALHIKLYPVINQVKTRTVSSTDIIAPSNDTDTPQTNFAISTPTIQQIKA
jgi:hypothetical protein